MPGTDPLTFREPVRGLNDQSHIKCHAVRNYRSAQAARPCGVLDVNHKKCPAIDNSRKAEAARPCDVLHVKTNWKSMAAGNSGDV